MVCGCIVELENMEHGGDFGGDCIEEILEEILEDRVGGIYGYMSGCNDIRIGNVNSLRQQVGERSMRECSVKEFAELIVYRLQVMEGLADGGVAIKEYMY